MIFFIFEHFNAAFIQQYVAHLLETGTLGACICGWVEVVDNDYNASLYLAEKKSKRQQNTFYRRKY